MKPQVITKWLLSWIRQHYIFVYQTVSWIHSLNIIIYHQLDWRLEISRLMENCSYKSYTKSHQPNRVERSLSDINSSILLKMYENFLLQITDFTETQQIYNKYQSGYHKNYSNATSLSKLYDDIKLAMKSSEVTIRPMLFNLCVDDM